MPVTYQAELIEKRKLNQDIYHFKVKAPCIAAEAKQGQFLEIRVTDGMDPFLRRPISIYNAEKENGIVEFIFQIRGKGTKILAKKQEGDLIDVIGPLGYGSFKYEKYKKIAIIGGGIGIFPLHELAKNAKKEGVEVSVYLGFRSKDFVVLEDEFKQVCDQLVLTTDDGSYGKSGFAINYLKEAIEKQKVDCIYACGPRPMLKAVKSFAIQKEIPCQISLEEKMGCGLGACLGCAVKRTRKEDYLHVCKAGPVFEARDVEI